MAPAYKALLLLAAATAAAAQIQRSTNSVDVQVCAGRVLSSSRAAFLAVLAANLQGTLGSQAVYLDTEYTDAAGDICFLFVYQAPSPAAAAAALDYLSPPGGGAPAGTLLVPFAGGVTVNCTLAAAQWSGYAPSALGVPLPAQWTLDGLLLWGACGAGGLALCLAAACCYALAAAGRGREAAEERRLLAREDRIIRLLRAGRAHPPAKHPPPI